MSDAGCDDALSMDFVDILDGYAFFDTEANEMLMHDIVSTIHRLSEVHSDLANLYFPLPIYALREVLSRGVEGFYACT